MKLKQPELNKKFEDPIKGRTILLNMCSRTELVNFPEMKESYELFYRTYEPDAAAISELKMKWDRHTMTIVLATWCGDSKLQVPRFLKITDQMSIPETQVQLICVDGKKQAENGLVDGLDISHVPTFILSLAGKELGRIVEKPQTTLEDDLLKIIKS